MKIAVDTNVLARYLTSDDEAQAAEATAAIEGADTVFISTIVLCELVWVLRRSYRYTGAEIMDAVGRLAHSRNVEADHPAVEAGIAMLGRGGDFADGVIQYEADRARCDRLVTFDRDFVHRADRAGVVLLGARLTS